MTDTYHGASFREILRQLLINYQHSISKCTCISTVKNFKIKS